MTISNFVAYVKQIWKNKPDTSSPLSAERLNHLESGIKGNSDAIEKIAAAVVNQNVNNTNTIPSSAALYSSIAQVNSDLANRFTASLTTQCNGTTPGIHSYENYTNASDSPNGTARGILVNLPEYSWPADGSMMWQFFLTWDNSLFTRCWISGHTYGTWTEK